MSVEMEAYYKGFYEVYNMNNILDHHQRSLLRYALDNQMSFAEAFNMFNDIFLYEVFKIHLAFRPTLKRLAALALIQLLDEYRSKNKLSGSWHKAIDGFIGKYDLPVSLYQELVEFSRSLWTVDIFYCGAQHLDFSPELSEPREAVGKEMLLIKSEYDFKVAFRSVTPGWDCNLVFWVIPRIFFVFSLFRVNSLCGERSMCLDEIMAEDNQGRIKIVFLQFVKGRYFFEFHRVNEKLDFSL